MAKNETFYAVSGFLTFGVVFLPVDTTSAKTLLTAPAEGCIVRAINVSSTDTSARYFELSVSDGVTTYVLGTVTIPITAGRHATGVTPSVGLLDGANMQGLERDFAGNYIIKLGAGWSLEGRMISAITTDKALHIVGAYDSITA